MLIGAAIAPKTCFAGFFRKELAVVVLRSGWLVAAVGHTEIDRSVQPTSAEVESCLDLLISCATKREFPSANQKVDEKTLMHELEGLTLNTAIRQDCLH